MFRADSVDLPHSSPGLLNTFDLPEYPRSFDTGLPAELCNLSLEVDLTSFYDMNGDFNNSTINFGEASRLDELQKEDSNTNLYELASADFFQLETVQLDEPNEQPVVTQLPEDPW
ncbi:unnamed protein product [Protopolystoma xenopodis]|uniref:Uncharacterized protein n=1 Tax=Protopolystoma xenopodis TaxID=117903 RepID=A0A448XIE7_9PLAT|nr:unnamed protein product [Protopolystoma xenopodis]